MTTADLVERFADRFVDRDRRDRVKLLLCSDKPARRRQGIEAVERWLESYEEISGSGATTADALRRLGDRAGILISERDVSPMTLLEAYNESSGSFDALFLSTDGALAALFLEVGGPLVCRAPKRGA